MILRKDTAEMFLTTCKKRVITAIFSLLMVLMVVPAAFASETTERRVVRVAFPEQMGMSQIDNTGKLVGYNYDYLEKIAELTGWEMEYVTYDTGDTNSSVMDAMQDVMDGKVDLLGPMLRNAATEEMFEYPENNYGTVYTTLCVDINSTLHRSNLDIKKTYKIGLYEKAEQRNSEVLNYLESDNIPYEIVYYPSVKDQLVALRDGSVDMVSAVSLSPYDNTRMFAKFAPRPYYFVTTKGNKELADQLDEAISLISAIQPNFQDRLFDTYFGERVDYFIVTDAQRKTLEGINKISVLCVDMDAPYVYSDDGEPKGALVEIIKDFAENLGIAVEFTFCEDVTAAEQVLSDNSFDLVMGMPFTTDFCAKYGFVRTDPVFSAGLSYAKKEYTEGIDNHTVAIVKGLEGLFDHGQFKDVLICENMDECLSAVEKGRAELAAGDRSVMDYYINSKGSVLMTVGVEGRTREVCIAVSRTTALPLVSVLNNLINSLSSTAKNTYLDMGNDFARSFSVTTSLRYLVTKYPGAVALVILLIFLLIGLRIRGMQRDKKHLEALNKSLEEARAETEKANIELENASIAKTNFLFNMSHDIRTPMNAILGYSHLVKKELTDPKLLEYHEKIENAGDLLLSIINNVLNMARIESGKVELDEEYINSGSVINEIMSVFEKLAADKQITIVKEWNVSHSNLMCDQTKIKEIFLNLISNAVKYTPAGGTVYIRATELPCEKEGYIRIKTEIEDTGIGMSKDYLPHLFDSFSRERNTTTSKVSGTGLGMPIVKKLVELMGGTIEVESELGKGTKFTIVLTHKIADDDYYEQQKTTSNEVVKESLVGKKILLAEDNELNAEIAMLMLEQQGFIVEWAKDGIECVARIEQEPAGTFDLILMDIQMPNMDGYKATKSIRQLGDSAKACVPIIAMTANAFEEDRKNAFDAGMNGHVAKPINIDELIYTLTQVLNG
ncbi:MAG: transporter substrate-binding domain-containing protein [Eubacteriales bacterium]|nr:transporter substrate-binding domain-containing protein [Eubacteriales bacterium]